MNIAQMSNYNKSKYAGPDLDYERDIDKDLNNLFLFTQGRVRFGNGTSGNDGENVSGQFLRITTNAVINTEDTFSHTIGAIPIGYIVLWQDKAGSIYQGPTTGTAWTNSNIYLKCSVASVSCLLFLLK